MSVRTGEFMVGLLVVALLLWTAYSIGHSRAHEQLLAQCKSEEHGIRLHVGNKRYFYYCSYAKP